MGIPAFDRVAGRACAHQRDRRARPVRAGAGAMGCRLGIREMKRRAARRRWRRAPGRRREVPARHCPGAGVARRCARRWRRSTGRPRPASRMRPPGLPVARRQLPTGCSPASGGAQARMAGRRRCGRAVRDAGASLGVVQAGRIVGAALRDVKVLARTGRDPEVIPIDRLPAGYGRQASAYRVPSASKLLRADRRFSMISAASTSGSGRFSRSVMDASFSQNTSRLALSR